MPRVRSDRPALTDESPRALTDKSVQMCRAQPAANGSDVCQSSHRQVFYEGCSLFVETPSVLPHTERRISVVTYGCVRCHDQSKGLLLGMMNTRGVL